MIDLDEEDEDRITNAVMRGKEVNISELQANLDRAQYVIHFLEQENQQLKTKKIISEVRTIKAQREVEKTKALLEETLERFGEIYDE